MTPPADSGHSLIDSKERSFFERVLFSPHERRLRAGWRLSGQSGILLIITIGISLVLALAVAIAIFIEPDLVEASGSSQTVVLGLSVLVALPSISLSVWIARRYLDHRSFLSLGLDWKGPALRDLLIGFLIPLPLFSAAFLVQWGLGWMHIEGWGWTDGTVVSTIVGVTLGLLGFVAVGFYEELLFRGYYLQNLRDGTGLALALLLSSLLFAVAHAGNFSASLASTLGIFGAGYFLAYGWLRTSSLWLPIGLHTGWNFFQGPIFGFAVSGTSISSLVVQSVDGPELVTGGGFGPEAGLLVLPMLAVGSGLIWLYTRDRNTAQAPNS